MSDIEGKTVRVTASDSGGERVSIKGRRRGDVRHGESVPVENLMSDVWCLIEGKYGKRANRDQCS